MTNRALSFVPLPFPLDPPPFQVHSMTSLERGAEIKSLVLLSLQLIPKEASESMFFKLFYLIVSTHLIFRTKAYLRLSALILFQPFPHFWPCLRPEELLCTEVILINCPVGYCGRHHTAESKLLTSPAPASSLCPLYRKDQHNMIEVVLCMMP
jgi:uncharacterized membrane protein